MTDIDAEVAAFAAELDGLNTLTVIDLDAVQRDVGYLVRTIVDAPTATDAAVAIREAYDTYAHDAAYTEAVIVGAALVFSAHTTLSADLTDLPDLLAKLDRVSIAVRGLGYYRGGAF